MAVGSIVNALWDLWAKAEGIRLPEFQSLSFREACLICQNFHTPPIPALFLTFASSD